MGLFNLWGKSINVERDREGVFTYSFLENGGFSNSKNYLNTSLTNPVLLAIIALRSKIYSQMKITHLDPSGNPIENSDIIKLFRQPNYFQSQQDFLFQQMWFLSATGTNLTYRINALSQAKSLYNLIPSEIKLHDTQKLKKFISTKKDIAAYEEQSITYTLDEEKINIKLKDIIPTYDLANGLTTNSLMSSTSRLSGIAKTIENIDENLLSKNVNLKMSQKYLVASEGDGNQAQIQDGDRNDIIRKIGSKSVLITNQLVKAQHLVSDMKKLFLDEQFSHDALTCLLAFDMNRDILNYFSNGASTHENQSQGFINWIQNSIQNDADNTMNSFASSFGLIDSNESLKASFDHLPVMQLVMKSKIETLQLYINTLVDYPIETKIKLIEEFKETLGL